MFTREAKIPRIFKKVTWGREACGNPASGLRHAYPIRVKPKEPEKEQIVRPGSIFILTIVSHRSKSDGDPARKNLSLRRGTSVAEAKKRRCLRRYVRIGNEVTSHIFFA